MKRRALLALALLAAAPAIAQDLPPGVTQEDRTAIQRTIREQLDAFQVDDAAAAYAKAAPNIKRLFPTKDSFLSMVQQGYPPVHRSRSADFSELALREGDLVQEVELIGPDGRPVLALYTMQKTPEGQWLIAGCNLIPSARLGV